MRSNEALEKDVDRLQGWLSELAARVNSLEISRAKFIGVMFACSFFGSTIGSVFVIVISHYWK